MFKWVFMGYETFKLVLGNLHFIKESTSMAAIYKSSPFNIDSKRNSNFQPHLSDYLIYMPVVIPGNDKRSRVTYDFLKLMSYLEDRLQQAVCWGIQYCINTSSLHQTKGKQRGRRLPVYFITPKGWVNQTHHWFYSSFTSHIITLTTINFRMGIWASSRRRQQIPWCAAVMAVINFTSSLMLNYLRCTVVTRLYHPGAPMLPMLYARMH